MTPSSLSIPKHCPGCGLAFDFSPGDSVPYGLSSQCPAEVHLPSEILFCKHCQLGVATPMFTDKEESIIYNQGEFWKTVNSQTNLRRISLALALAESRWKFIRPILGPQTRSLRLLDVGAGLGAFGLAVALDPSITLTYYRALEPDRRLGQELTRLWKKLNLRAEMAYAQTLGELNPTDAPYDVIVISHVLEHLRDPRAFLRVLKPYLAPGGLLFTEVPHQDFLFKKDVFPHVLFYTPENLKVLLESEGFKVKTSGTFGKNRDINPLGKHASRSVQLSTRLLSKMSDLLPLKFQKYAYTLLYGSDQHHPQGIWLRAAATL